MFLCVTLKTLDELMDIVLVVEALLTVVTTDSTSVNTETSEVLSCGTRSVAGLNAEDWRGNNISVCVVSDGVKS